MENTKIYLWRDEVIRTKADRPSISCYLLPAENPKPAILIIPGGGYSTVCEDMEGSPVAQEFNKLGFHAFVLDYRTAPDRWPAPQLDAMRAMKIIRGNAEKWNIDPRKISVCGFSAGGHLAGCLGGICNGLDASDGDSFDSVSHRPDAMILCYGVLAFADWSNLETMHNLLGDSCSELRDACSLTTHVDENTPPTFLMHTICDQLVSYRNSMEFAEAMARTRLPCQLALYYWGDHGMLLGGNTSDVGCWPVQARNFLANLWNCADDPAGFFRKYTNPYQAELNRALSYGKCAHSS